MSVKRTRRRIRCQKCSTVVTEHSPAPCAVLYVRKVGGKSQSMRRGSFSSRIMGCACKKDGVQCARSKAWHKKDFYLGISSASAFSNQEYLVQSDKRSRDCFGNFLTRAMGFLATTVPDQRRHVKKCICWMADSQSVRSWPARSEPSTVTTYKECLRQSVERFG